MSEQQTDQERFEKLVTRRLVTGDGVMETRRIIQSLTASLAQVTQDKDVEIAYLQDVVTRHAGRIATLSASLDALHAENERLKGYVQHTMNCPALPANADRFSCFNGLPYRVCSCGLDPAPLPREPS